MSGTAGSASSSAREWADEFRASPPARSLRGRAPPLLPGRERAPPRLGAHDGDSHSGRAARAPRATVSRLAPRGSPRSADGCLHARGLRPDRLRAASATRAGGVQSPRPRRAAPSRRGRRLAHHPDPGQPRRLRRHAAGDRGETDRSVRSPDRPAPFPSGGIPLRSGALTSRGGTRIAAAGGHRSRGSGTRRAGVPVRLPLIAESWSLPPASR